MRLRLTDNLRWHADQLKQHLKEGNLALVEAHARWIQSAARVAIIQFERESTIPITVERPPC